MKKKGTIYIEEQVTEQNKARENQASDKQKLMSYWGYRFETLSTISKPPRQVTDSKNDPHLKKRLTESANTNIQYCIVVKTKLGNNSILMGAEVDCCRGTQKKRHRSGRILRLKKSKNRCKT